MVRRDAGWPSPDQWQDVGAVLAGIGVGLLVTAAVLAVGACTVVTFGVCGVAAASVVTYHYMSGEKTTEGYVQSALIGGITGFAAPVLGPVVRTLLGKATTGATSEAGSATASSGASAGTLSGKVVMGEGFFDVVGHGTPKAVFDAAGSALSPSQLAGVIRSTPSWAGQDVRLLSCSMGCPTGTFSQSLARGGIVFDEGGTWASFVPGD